MCFVFHAWTFNDGILFEYKIWLSQKQKELPKWNKKHFTLCHKCSLLDLTKQNSKNAAYKTFKLQLFIFWKFSVLCHNNKNYLVELTESLLMVIDRLKMKQTSHPSLSVSLLLISDTIFSKWVTKEAVAKRYSVKKVFLEISQNSQENTCARVSFLIKLQAWGLQLS